MGPSGLGGAEGFSCLSTSGVVLESSGIPLSSLWVGDGGADASLENRIPELSEE